MKVIVNGRMFSIVDSEFGLLLQDSSGLRDMEVTLVVFSVVVTILE